MARSVRQHSAALIAGALSLTAAVAVAGVVAGAPVASSSTHASMGTKKGELLETEQTSVGTILVDRKGRTVYVFMADKPGVSNCSGQCLTYWPPVLAPAKLPSSLPGVTGTLGSITRSDNGVRQLTINGWPLYLYAGDTKKGMIAGQGSNGGGAKWWVVAPSGKKITKPAPHS